MKIRQNITEWRKGCSNAGQQSSPYQFPGACPECTDGMVESVLKEGDRMEAEIARLKRAILHYLDHPGCNIPARNTAMARLKFEAERTV